MHVIPFFGKWAKIQKLDGLTVSQKVKKTHLTRLNDGSSEIQKFHFICLYSVTVTI